MKFSENHVAHQVRVSTTINGVGNLQITTIKCLGAMLLPGLYQSWYSMIETAQGVGQKTLLSNHIDGRRGVSNHRTNDCLWTSFLG